VAAAADEAAAGGRGVKSCLATTGKGWGRRHSYRGRVCPMCSREDVAAPGRQAPAATKTGQPRQVSGPVDRCGSRRNPRGFVAAGKPLFRSGCSVLWHSSKYLMEWKISFPQPLPIAVCGRADVAPAAGSKCDKVGQICRKLWQKGTFPAPPDPAHDLIRTPRTRCLNEACQKIEHISLEGWERSHALVEHMCTFARAHLHHVAHHHRKRLSKRLLVHPRSH